MPYLYIPRNLIPELERRLADANGLRDAIVHGNHGIELWVRRTLQEIRDARDESRDGIFRDVIRDVFLAWVADYNRLMAEIGSPPMNLNAFLEEIRAEALAEKA